MTLTELTTISNPEYLFQFIEEQSDESVFCILTDTSMNKSRFNEFTISDGIDVVFPIDGFYSYKVFEQSNGSGNLNPSGLNVVEVGRVHVYINDSAPNQYNNENEITSIYE